MRKRLGIALAGSLAALACLAGTSAGASSDLRITHAGGDTFPQRTLILTLPAGERVQASQVSVRENGQGVVGLAIRPAGSEPGEGAGTALVIDASDSMRGAPIDSALKAGRGFAGQRNTNQRLAVVSFNADTNVITSFTKSQDKIDAALTQKPKIQYGTHLYDAVAQAITLAQAAGITVGSIVVLSDGADNGSKISLDQVTQNARDAGIRVFTVAFHSKTFRPTALQQLATATGGSFSSASSPEDLARIYDELGLQLSHEYLLTYNSTIAPEKPVDVSVAVKGVGTAKAGYVTPALVVPGAVYHESKLDGVWTSWVTMLALGLLIPLLVAGAIVVPITRRGSTVKSRVSDYVSMPTQNREAEALVSRVFIGTERSLEKTQWWQRFKDALRFSDVPLPPVQVLIGTIVLTLFAMWALALLATPLALLGLAVPLIVRAAIVARATRKRKAFADQLADNLDVLASGLRAGHSLVGSLAVVVSDATEPSRTEFQRIVTDEQLGVPLETAIDSVAKRMKNRDIQQVALVASVQNETGGNAAEVLDRVTDSIRERQELRRLVNTLTAQGRLARWIVSLMPVALLIGMTLINKDYMKPLFSNTSGQVALAIATLMVVTGSIVIGRIVDIKV